MADERLQKLMAQGGWGSRRACEEMIEQGRVTVNGRLATLGMKADPAKDDIRVDGMRLKLPGEPLYIAYHKPAGVISDEDVGGRYPAAREQIPVSGHLYPVGRLDVRSEGLMLFTNDGDLAHRLTHPRYEHPKVYHVWVEGVPDEKALASWRRGVVLDGEPTGPAGVEIIGKGRDGARLEVTLREGRKRQIRRVGSLLGHPVRRILRVKIGPLELGDLPPGSWRALTPEEVEALKRVTRRPRRRQPAESAALKPAAGHRRKGKAPEKKPGGGPGAKAGRKPGKGAGKPPGEKGGPPRNRGAGDSGPRARTKKPRGQ
ncbi:MAG: hypothetical protein Kow00124_23280 [Anaerolineae bacterium]